MILLGGGAAVEATAVCGEGVPGGFTSFPAARDAAASKGVASSWGRGVVVP